MRSLTVLTIFISPFTLSLSLSRSIPDSYQHPNQRDSLTSRSQAGTKLSGFYNLIAIGPGQDFDNKNITASSGLLVGRNCRAFFPI